MGQAIGQTLPFGVGIALSPLPIVMVVLMLGAPKGRATALAFLAGWMIGLAVLGTVLLLLASDERASEAGGGIEVTCRSFGEFTGRARCFHLIKRRIMRAAI